MDYIEKVKQLIIDADIKFDEDLYPLLLQKMKREKQEIIDKYLCSLSGDAIIDIGGADGYLIKDLNFKNRTVIDKREFPKIKGIHYIYAEYTPGKMYGNYDYAIMSEFLHLFNKEKIKYLIKTCEWPLIIIENKYDDFLDLRLRMWGKGRCVDPYFISDICGSQPDYETSDFYIWRTECQN